eukprot:TRINITY_DN36142_c0_g1_i1.p1 TRINITY_DN36142_c0_g1~~TRINITY_DN36142_c0_g1_i1.p1  ORF type:complete len:234 (+),score=28.32 TRINITY_DN36142_c0_g1_i1:120-821(+)
MSGFEFDDPELRGHTLDGNIIDDSKAESDVEVDTVPSVETFGSDIKVSTPPLQVSNFQFRSPCGYQKEGEHDSDYGDEVPIHQQENGFDRQRQQPFQTLHIKPNANQMACSAPIGIPTRWTVPQSNDKAPIESEIQIPSTFVPPHILAQMEDEKRQDWFEVGLSPQQSLKREKLRMRNKILTMTGFAGPEESQASSYLRQVGRPPKLNRGALGRALTISAEGKQKEQSQQQQH